MGKFIDLAYKLFGRDSVSKGLTISRNDISYYDTVDRGKKDLVHIFMVNSQHLSYYYDVNIITRGSDVVSFYCECPQFHSSHTCKHVAACLINYGDSILKEPPTQVDISSEILSLFSRSSGVRERVFIDIELDFSNYIPSFKLFVGIKKKYVINSESKLQNFMSAYLNGDLFEFGVNFTYDPKIHFFSDDDIQLLSYFNGYTRNSGYYRSDPFSLNGRELSYLIDKLDGREFSIKDYGKIYDIKNGLPTCFNLVKDKDNYSLSINDFSNYMILDKNFKYIAYDHVLYLIPFSYRKLIGSFVNNSLESLVFNNDNVELFKEGLLQNIKNDIVIDEGITDIVVAGEPIVNLYFDLNRDKVVCGVKFDYKGNVIDYFDDGSSVVREIDFESSIINDLIDFHFIVDKKKIFIDDIDFIGDFLSDGLSVLSEKYNVFTSKKIDNIGILKKSNVSSNFSIGTDGIMSYNFSTDNIDMDELDSVLDSLKKKKRYYKLKNGNIVDLENNAEINELGNIFSDLDISTRDLSGSVEVPKYRALYIDSLKRNKYKSIKTDNSFDRFIDNFSEFKDISIDFLGDKDVLRDYQKDGVKWLYTLYKCDLGGILADEMGLGKSLQTICFIKQVVRENKDARIMIVCPTSLVYNWKKEFDKFGPELKYVTVFENKAKRLEIINDFDKYNVFITSYGLIRNDNDEYEDKFFDVCIIDEAQAIKNYQAGMTKEIKKIKAHTKIALTGTPLENSIMELWSIFDFIMPGYLNSIHRFREMYGIHDVDKESLDKLSNLNYQIKPFILRRKKIDVVHDLPDKIEDNVYLDLPDKQKALYVSVLKESEREFQEILATEGIGKARFKVLQLLMRLRQICVDPSIIYENYKGESIKMERLLESVSNYVRDGHKILIFSSFKMVIDRVKAMFDKNNISSYMIAGDVKSRTRMELVDKFNSDSTNCFLITLKSGGTGLNLTSADVVIHLDIWWNPQVENQATDRAHRIGQTKSVNVVKFITRGTIEEKIIELQNKKKILSDNLIEGKADNVLNSLSEKEIRSLLSYGEDD